MQRRPFVLWIVGTSVLVLGILFGTRMLRLLSSSSRLKHSSVRHLQIIHSRVRLIRGMCFGLVSGILSAHTLLLAKSAVELLVRTIVDRSNQFNRWQSWIILIGMIMIALTQLFFLHHGLKLCSTSILYPFVFCIYNVIAILDGLIYFRQMSELTGFHAGLIALGTVILLSGVLCLSWRLEDIDSHAAITVVGPSQTGLGPGMAIMEEDHTHGTEEEEEQAGERQPLLQAAPPRRGSTHRRAPSLPSSLTAPHRGGTSDVDSASIWAELDDSDYEYGDSDTRSSLFYRSSNTVQGRPRSKSGTLATLKDDMMRRPRRSTTNPIYNYRTWDPRRIPPSVQEGNWRKASNPASESGSSPLKQQAFWVPPESTNTNMTGYGTQDASSGHQTFLPGEILQQGPEAQQPGESGSWTGLLAGSRNPLANAWRSSVRFVSRWTSQQQPENEYEHELPPDLEDHHHHRASP